MKIKLEQIELLIPDEVVLAEARRIMEDRAVSELSVKNEIQRLTRSVSIAEVIDKRK